MYTLKGFVQASFNGHMGTKERHVLSPVKFLSTNSLVSQIHLLQIFEKNSTKFVTFWLATCMSMDVFFVNGWQGIRNEEKDK